MVGEKSFWGLIALGEDLGNNINMGFDSIMERNLLFQTFSVKFS